MNVIARGTLREQLREATLRDHQALDRHRVLRALITRDLTLESYAFALECLYIPQYWLEQAVCLASRRLETGHVPHRRVPLLVDDLHALGMVAPSPPENIIPVAGDHAQWLGQAYVLEGARLGSCLIARKVGENLPGRAPCRFFGSGNELAGWHRLRKLLEEQLATAPRMERAVHAARKAFRAYRSGLDLVC